MATFFYAVTMKDTSVHQGGSHVTASGTWAVSPGQTRHEVYKAITTAVRAKYGLHRDSTVSFFSLERNEL